MRKIRSLPDKYSGKPRGNLDCSVDADFSAQSANQLSFENRALSAFGLVLEPPPRRFAPPLLARRGNSSHDSIVGNWKGCDHAYIDSSFRIGAASGSRCVVGTAGAFESCERV